MVIKTVFVVLCRSWSRVRMSSVCKECHWLWHTSCGNHSDPWRR